MKHIIFTLLIISSTLISTAQEISVKATPLFMVTSKATINNTKYDINKLASFKLGVYYQKEIDFNWHLESGIELALKGYNHIYDYKKT